MKKYRLLENGEKATAGDEIKGLGDRWLKMHESHTGEDPYVVNSLSSPVRREVLHTGDVQFLMCVSILVPVIVNCDGREQESIEAEAGELAYQKVLDDPRKYISYENVDWANCKVDEMQPVSKPLGYEQSVGRGNVPKPEYRMLEIGESCKTGDEMESYGNWIPVHECHTSSDDPYTINSLSGKFRRPITDEPQYRMLQAGETIMVGDQMRDKEVVQWFNCDATVGCTVDEDEPYEYRRKISAEPQYRLFKEGDVIEEGDQTKLGLRNRWVNLPAPFPRTIDGSIIGNIFFRKLNK